jgi:hypothetical protein
MDTQA